MRVVLDTNIVVSALLIETSLPAQFLAHWRKGQFILLSAEEQIAELNRVTRYPRIRERLSPATAGRLVNQIRELSVMVGPLPTVDVSPDPYDNYLLAMARAGKADYLVTGDKADLLSLGKYEGTRIVSARRFMDALS